MSHPVPGDPEVVPRRLEILRADERKRSDVPLDHNFFEVIMLEDLAIPLPAFAGKGVGDRSLNPLCYLRLTEWYSLP